MDLVISSDDDQEQESDFSGVGARDMERLGNLLLSMFSCYNLGPMFNVIINSITTYDYLPETLM